MGYTLALHFKSLGYEVGVIDCSSEVLLTIAESEFEGTMVRGYGDDQDKLREAGTQDADLFIAVTNSDNTNIFAAEVAVHEFSVKRAIARVDEPAKAGLFTAYGIETVSPVELTIEKIKEMVEGGGE